MHYCGQAAATFKYKPGYVKSLNLAPSNVVEQQLATVVAIAVSVIFLFFVLIVSISDLRMYTYLLIIIIISNLIQISKVA